jgi:5'(3')-deoxyribonucleotidase
MNDFVLAVDLDGCCGDYSQALRSTIAQTRGIAVTDLPEQTTWDFSEWGLHSREEFLAAHTHAVSRRRIFATMDAIAGCSEALWALSRAGIYIRIVTHRLHGKGHHAIAVADTVTWLDAHDIPYRDLCFLGDKAAIGANTYIDDGPHNIEALDAAGADVIIFDQAYNRHMDGTRACDWNEVADLVLARFERWRGSNPTPAT